MNLHRTGARPEWLSTPRAQRNLWQRTALRTRGLLTPGNVVTLVGFVLASIGLAELLSQNYVAGVMLLTVGRLADVADGWLAHATKTKSPLGELFDASIDKVITIATLIVLLVTGIAPWWVLVLISVPQIVSGGVGVWATRQHRRPHPSRAGKLSMAAAWVALVGFVVLRAWATAPQWLEGLTYGVAAFAVSLGSMAAIGYVRELRTRV